MSLRLLSNSSIFVSAHEWSLEVGNHFLAIQIIGLNYCIFLPLSCTASCDSEVHQFVLRLHIHKGKVQATLIVAHIDSVSKGVVGINV